MIPGFKVSDIEYPQDEKHSWKRGKSVRNHFLETSIRMIFDRIKRAFEVYSGKDLEILNSYCAQAQKLNRVYCVFVLTVVSWHSILSLTKHTINVITPENGTKLTERPRVVHYHIGALDGNLLIGVIHGFIGDIFGFLCVAGFDTLYYHSIYYTCAIFAIAE
ncbi:hypothetical protein QAD02_018513 [Eretmocerus hayati]|uniref:Uncharacterized protein n=1 Tax=Eretmocerus hayati TaxID=131215 RepID=A0ACC2PIS5_9HYME|nr:hypothetical protein QAD02_018513 [Eretmocerus hayati]